MESVYEVWRMVSVCDLLGNDSSPKERLEESDTAIGNSQPSIGCLVANKCGSKPLKAHGLRDGK